VRGFGSYRTYEEWKLPTEEQLDELFDSSYRTYEEWKLYPDRSTLAPNSGSYRTYEEWKLFPPNAGTALSITVLTVPMRNGNNFFRKMEYRDVQSSYRTYEEWKLNNLSPS